MTHSLLTPRKIQALFLAKAEAKHARFVPAYNQLKKLVENKGGVWAGDHIALRTTDERVAELLRKAGAVMNLKRPAGEEDYPYKFPDKLLKSFDLLGEDHRDLKLFVSVWDESVAGDKAAVAAIKEDITITWNASLIFYDKIRNLTQKAEKQGGLSREDAASFVGLIVDKLLTRNGSPLKKSTYDTVAKVSGELASAMVLGAGINHFTVDVRVSGFASTEEMRCAAEAAGMEVLPQTSGAAGGLQQSATIGALEEITLLAENGSTVKDRTRLRFMEFIWRPELKNAHGEIQTLPDGTPDRYARFEQNNAAKIFEAARVEKKD